MSQQLPDELFRKGTVGHEDPPARPRRRMRAHLPAQDVDPLPKAGAGLSVRATVLLLLVSMAAAFLVGRYALFTGKPSAVVPSATQSVDADPYRVYEGPVVEMSVVDVTTNCGPDEDAAALVDEELETIWRCPGDADGARIRFEFYGPVDLAGLRIVNGNTIDNDTFLRERRITLVRWDFSDGRYFEHNLTANDREPQEVRFPRITTEFVEMTVRETTEPGDSEEDSDAISLTRVAFLEPAE